MNRPSALRSVLALVGLLLISLQGLAAPPRARNLYISGTTAGANPATFTAMEVGQTLKVWYSYIDPDGNAESGTTFQWYTYLDEFGTSKTAIAGATTQTLNVTAAMLGKHIGVEVKPRDNTAAVGLAYEFRPFDGTHPNPVLASTFSCTKAGGGAITQGNFIDNTTNLCAPRSTTWDITYTGIDWSPAAAPKIYIDWGDAGGTFVSITPILFNPLLTRVDTMNLANQSNQTWRTPLISPGVFGVAHTYAFPGSTPTLPDICTFTLRASFGTSTVNCNNFQVQPFTVWDKEDNTLLGTLDASHDPTSAGVETGEITDICQGDQSAIRIMDTSDFNCTQTLETIRENDDARWVQWVYGTANTVTTGPGATEKIIINGVSYTSAQLPVYGRVTYQAASTTTPLPSITDNIQMPTTGVAGQTFVVTMRSWNFCNRLDRITADGGFNPPQVPPFNVSDITRFTSGTGTDQPGLAPQFSAVAGTAIFANNAPVLRTYTIRIATKPPVLTASSNVQCYATATGGIPFTVTGFTANLVKWYNKDPRVGTGPALKLIQSSASTTLALSNYTAANNCIGAPINTSQAGGAGAIYSVWATQATTGAVPCESDPVEVILIIRPNFSATTTYPTTESSPTGSTSICNNTTPTYSKTAIVNPSYNIPVNKFTNAAQLDLNTQYSWSVGGGAAGITITPAAPPNTADYAFALTEPAPPTVSTTRQIQVQKQYTTAPTCPNNIPSPTFDVTVYYTSVAGTIGPATQTICEGSAITNISIPAAGMRGSITAWQKSVNGSAFANDAALGTTNTITPSVPIVAGALTTYRYQAIVQNGSCGAVTSGIATIIVNPKPTTATLTGNATVCAGTPTNLQVAIVGGTGPFTVILTDGVTPFTTNAYVSGANIPVTTATTKTYSIVSVTDSKGCVTSTNSGTATVTVSNATASVFAGSTNICLGGNTNLTVTITGGTSPFTINYTANGVAQAPKVGYISGSNINVAPIVTTTYALTSVIDANGCPSGGLSGTPVVTIGSTPTGATFSGGGPVCQNLSKNLSLTITGGVSPYQITVNNGIGVINNYVSGTAIPVPTAVVGTVNYSVTAIKDACNVNLAVGLITGNPQAVTVNALPTANNQSPSVCSDATAGTTATVNLTTLQAAINGGGGITYTWYTAYNAGTKVFSGAIATPAAAVVTNAVPVFAEVKDGNGCVSPATVTYAVTPRPAPPSGPTGSTYCSSTTPSAISVTNPGAGFTIDWFANPTGGAPLAGGVGTSTFTPPVTGATTTYYAETRMTTGLLCISTSRTAVVSTIDNLPATASAGAAQPSICSSAASVTMAATAVGSGGTGSWTVNGKVLYYQNFTSFANGVKTSAAGNGWTIDTSAPNAFNGAPASAYFEVRSNKFEAQNTNGNLGAGGANQADLIWLSPIINVSTLATVAASVDISNSGGLSGADDNISVFYRLNGTTVDNIFPTNGSNPGNFATATAQVTGIVGATQFQVVVKVRNDGNADRIQFDNVIIRESTAAAAAISISDPNSPTAVITGLPAPADGAAPITSTLTWTTASQLGACPSTTSTVAITLNPAPKLVAAQSTNVCSGLPVNYEILLSPANFPVGSTFTWVDPDGGGGPATAKTNLAADPAGTKHITDVLVNTSGATTFLDYQVTPKSALGCTGVTTAVRVNTLPAPKLNTPQSKTICSGQPVNYEILMTPLNSPAGTTYSWPDPDGPAAPGTAKTIAADPAGTKHITDILTNFTAAPVTTTYAVTPTGPGPSNCVGATQNVVITVNPNPVANPVVGSNNVCAGSTVLLYQVTPHAGSTYAWTVPAPFVKFGGGTPTDFFVLVQFPAVGSGNITMTETNVYNCTGTVNSLAVSVANAPGALSINGADPVCKNQIGVAYSVASPTPGSTYNWSASGATITSASSGPNLTTISVNFSLASTASITVSEVSTSGCTGTPFTKNIAVSDIPTMTSANNQAICSGATPSLAFGATVPSNFSWEVTNITGAITAATAPALAVGNTGTGNLGATFTGAQALINNSSAVGSVTFDVSPSTSAAPFCQGPTQSVVITVNPKPVIPSQTVTICSGATFTVAPTDGTPTAATIVPIGTTYTWAAPVVSGGITGGSAQAVASPNISQTLTNPTNTVQTATYTVTPTSGAAGTCVGTAFTVTVTVNPKPVIPAQTATICSGTAFTVTPANGVPAATTIVPTGTTYTWGAPIVTGGITGGSAQVVGQPNISQTLTNPTSIPQTATYTVTPTSGAAGACIGATFNVTVTVNPTPVIPIQTTTVCSTFPFTISPADGVPTAATIVPAGTTYTWTAPVVTGGLTGGSAQAAPQANISQTLANPTSSPQTATYTVTPTSGAAGSCGGAPFTVTVTVNPAPSIPAQSQTICSGGTFTLTPTNGTPTAATVVPSGTTYTWTNPIVTGGITGGSAQAVGQPQISQTLTNPTNAVQTATYTVTPTSGAAGACVGATFQLTVTVNPMPVIPAQNATICSGNSFNVAPADGVPTPATIVPAGTTYTWTAPVVTGGVTGGSAQAVGQPNISQTLTNPTNIVQTATYTVTPKSGAAGGCVGAAFTLTVTVNPKPVIGNQTPAICSGTAFTISPSDGVPSSATIVPAGTTYTWPAPVITGGVTGASAQAVPQPNISQTLTNPTNTVQTVTYTVTPTSGASGACVGATFTVTVTVNPKPVIPAQTATICSGNAFSITPADGVPAATTIVPGGTTYTWPAPVVSGGITGGSAQLTGVASIGQTLTNPTSVVQTATYTVTPTSGASGSCVGSTFTVTVTVNPKPVISNQTASICSGAAFSITPTDGLPTAATIVPLGTTYSWGAPVVTGGVTGGSAQAGQVSIGQVLTNPTNVSQTATYTVTPTSGAAGACVGSTFTVTVTVNPQPAIPNQTATICSGTAFTVAPVNNTPTAATVVPSGTTYTWTTPAVTGGVTGGSAQAVGQPSISQTLTNPTNAPQTATYTVTPTSGASGSCVGATFTVTVTVNPMPSIPSQVATVCSGATFTVTPANGVPSAATIVPAGTTYTWAAPVVTGGLTGGSAQAVGQPNISQTLTNPTSSTQVATYTVTPTSGGCVGATFSVIVSVNPKPAIPAQSASICSGSSFTISPTDGVPSSATIVPGGTTYTWTAPAVTGGVTGASAQAVPQPTISQTLTNPTNTVQTVTYTVTPTSGSCTGSTFTIVVNVNPKPFVPDQTPTICSGTAFSVNPADGVPTAATIVPAGTTYSWPVPVVTGGVTGATAQSGQSAIGQTLTNPTNTPQTATYTVTPTSGAAGSCVGATFTITVTVNPKPAVPAQSPVICSGGTFTVSPADGIPTAATIVPAGTTYTWPAPAVTGGVTGASAQAVGVASISQTLTNPTNSVQTVTYTVTPTSGAAGSCVGSAFTIVVTVNPQPVIPNQAATICSGTLFTVTPSNGVPTAATIVPTGTTYTWPVPVVTGGITGATAQLTAVASISQTLTNPTNTVQTATYTVTPTSGAAGSCVGATFQVVVTVNPQPVIPNQTTSICSGTSFTVTPANGVPTSTTIVPTGTTYTWTAPVVTGGILGGSAQVAGVASISQALTNPTNTPQTATYTVTPTSGAAGSCVGATFTVTVTVNPKPAIPNQTPVICSGSAFTVTPSDGLPTAATIVPAGTTYTWPAPAVTGGVTGASAQPVGVTSISQTLTNPTNTVQTVTYTVTPTSGAAGTCVGGTFTVTVTVNPQPVIPNQTTTICSGAAFSVSPTNGAPTAATIVPAGTTYSWAVPIVTGGVTGGSAQSGQALISQTLVNPTNNVQTATYTVTPTSGAAGSCVGATFTITVTVNPKPSIPPQTVAICSGAAFSITPVDGLPSSATIVPAGTTYTWPAPAVTGGVTGASAQAVGVTTISQTLTNPTNTVQTVTYTVTPTSGAAGSCVGSTFTVTVSVNPKPAIPNQAPAICSGTAFSVSPADGVPTAATIVPSNTTYSWPLPVVTGGITGGSAQNFQTSVSQTLVNPTNTVQTATYTVTPTSGAAGACVGSPFTIVVSVNPVPAIPAQAATICSGAAFNVAPVSGNPTAATIVPAGTTYAWAVPIVTGGILGGSAQTGQASISQTLTNPTNTVQTATYTVTPTSGAAGSCVGSSFTVTVTVNPKPDIPNQTQTVCSGSAFNISPTDGLPTSATIVPAGTKYTWTAPVVTGGLTGGSAQVAPQSSISQTLANPTAVAQTATYTVTPTSGAAGSCVGAPFTVTITVNPQPIIPNQTATICSGNAFSITPVNGVPTAATVVPTGTTYSWPVPVVTGGITGGSAQTGQASITQSLVNPTNSVQTATYTVTPTSGAAGSCVGATFTVTVTVNPKPSVPPQAVAICSGQTFSVTPTDGLPSSATIVPIGTTYTWTAPAVTGGVTGSSAQAVGVSSISQTLTNPTNTVQTVTYTVTPTSGAAGSCVGSTFTVTVTVNPKPSIPNQSPAICSGTAFSVSPTDGVPTAATIVPTNTTYTWPAPVVTGGITGASAQTSQTSISQTLVNPTNTVQTATYTVTPTSGAAGACVGSPFTIVVSVNPVPAIPAQAATICSGAAFNVTPANGTPSAATIVPAGTTYAWTVPIVTGGITGGSAQTGQASISQTLTNPTSSVQSATYTVTPTSGAAGSCVGSTFTVTVTVNPKPVIPNQTQTVCSGVAFNISPTDGVPSSATIVPASTKYTWGAPVVTGGMTGGSAQAVPQNSISQTLTNPTAVAQTATYTVTPISGAAGSCVGATFQVTITVNPVPMAAAVTTIQRCSGSAINLNLMDLINNVAPFTGGNSVNAIFSYTVLADFPLDVAPAVFPGTFDRVVASAANITNSFTNVSNHDVTLSFTVTPYSVIGNCAGTPFTVNVVYHPEPVGSNLTQTGCASTLNHNIQTSQITNGLASVFTYTVSSSDEVNVPTPAALDRVVASNAAITDTFNNPTSSVVTITYTITPYNAANPTCAGVPFTYKVDIGSSPIGISDTKAAVCSDASFTIDPQGNITNGVISTFTWTAVYDPGLTVGGFPAPASGSGVINMALTNTSNVQKNATYTITPHAGPCPGTPVTFTIIKPIDPEPVMDPTLATKTICSTNATSSNKVNIVLNTNGVSVAAANYNVTLKSQDPSLTGTPTTGLGLSANAIQNDTYNNVTALPLNVVYTVVPVAAGGCLGDPFDITVTVEPEPVVSNALSNTVCSTDISNIILSTNGVSVGAASYRLVGVTVPGGLTPNAGNVAVGTVSGINMIKGDSYTNATNAAITVIYDIRATSPSGCEGASRLINLTVNPAPVLDPGLSPTPVCSGVVSGVTMAVAPGSVAASTYNINSILFPGLTAGGSNTGIGSGKAANAMFNDVYVNTTSSPLTATYKIAPVSALGCVGPVGTIILTINPSPDLDNNLGKTVCSTNASGISFATTPSSVVAANYNLISVTIAGGLTPGGGNATFPQNGVAANYVAADTYTNPGNGTLTVTYRVEPVSGAGCKGPQEDIVLTVEPTIKATPINHNPTICSNSTPVPTSTDIELVSPTVPTAGTITFNYTAVSSVGAQITGFVPALTNLAAGYHIMDALVNNSNNAATVTYTITPVAAGAKGGAGCTGAPAIVVVTVEPRPKLIPSPLTKTVCEGTPVGISLSTTTVPSAGTVEYLLVSTVATGGVTGMSANGTVFAAVSTLNDNLSSPSTTTESVTYTFRPRINGGAGCIGDNVSVTVNVNPRPNISAVGVPAAICSGDQINISIVSDVSSTVSTWPAPTIAPTVGSVTGGSAGAGDQLFQILFNKTSPVVQTVSYTVTPQASGCAGTPITINVPVNPVPNVLGTATTTICSGGTLNVPLSSKVAAGVNFTWTVDDPSNLGGAPGAFDGSGTTINQVFTNNTGSQASLTYTITPILTAPGTTSGTCTGETKIMFVTVAPSLSAAFLNTPSPDFICSGSTEYLVFQFGGQAPFDFTYTKQGPTGPAVPTTVTNKGPVVVIQDLLTTAGAYTYTITSVTSHVNGVSCTTPFNVPFVVNVGDTDPSFNIISPVATCSPNQVSFQYNQVAGVIYTWRFGDAADSVYTATTTVPGKVIKHTYTNLSPTSTLTYPVSMQTELPAPYPGCFKSNAPKSVTIYPNIIPNVIADKTTICSGETIRFSNQSVGATSQSWSFREQGQIPETALGTSLNITSAFTNNTTQNPITYEVIYRGTNGNCPTPDQIIPIKVYRQSVAQFNEGTVPPYVNGQSIVNFTNTSSIINGTDFTYDWQFGSDASPASVTAVNPAAVTYVRPGPKNVVLVVTNTQNAFCKSTFEKTINVDLLPLVATFKASPSESCFPSKIVVTESNITGDVIEWRVYDANGRTAATSSAILPTFNIPSEGTYTITLKTSSSLTGQFAVATNQVVKVYAKPFASFDARPDVLYVPDTELTTFNFSTGANQYAWDFGDGGKSTEEEPKYIYKIEGVYDIQLIAMFDHGNNIVCSDTLTHKVVAKQGGVTKVPNAFTPNPAGPSGGQSGSGSFNDVFLPIVKGAEEFNLQIFDRWGNLIFESNNSQIGWDGYNVDGRLLPAGVYVYKLTIRLSDGQRSTQIGDVTMIR